jgi:glutamate racemase
MVEPAAPILMFDTGVGGLTVYDAVHALLPDAPIIYAADYAGMPYGMKTEAEVAARVAGLLGRMSERYRPRLACIACNTASTIALGMVRDVLEIPIVGTVPAIKPAAERTHTGTIGLIGTRGTIRQAYVDDLERDFAKGKTLLRIAAPDFVEQAEIKLRGGAVDQAVIRKVADELKAMPGGDTIDSLVLACTHFPLLREELAVEFGSDVAMIDGAAGIARRIAYLLDGQEFVSPGPNRFVLTGPIERADGLDWALAARNFGPAEAF